MAIYKKIIILIFVLGVIISMFSSCSNKKYNNYQIITQFEILSKDKNKIKGLKTSENDVEIILKTSYRSDVSFQLEISMLDNFHFSTFFINDNGKYQKDQLFKINLKETQGEFATIELPLKLNIKNIDHLPHDIIFIIKNVTTVSHNSTHGYWFLRFGINSDVSDVETIQPLLGEKSQIHNFEKASFESDIIYPAVRKEKEQFQVDLSFNIEKIYEGVSFHQEYEAHLQEKLSFLVLVIHNNQLLTINQGDKYIWGNTLLETKGTISFSVDKPKGTEEFIFVLIPYPFMQYETSDRYQQLAYNQIAYYQYGSVNQSK